MKKNKREVEPFRNNHVRPTEKQKQTFKHMGKAKSLQEAMLAGGYSKKTAVNPKENFVEREGTKVLLKEYTKHLENTGISPEMLAEIQAGGLFDESAQVRLGYLKETKKDFGLNETDVAVNVNVFKEAKKSAVDFIEGEEVK